MPPRDFTQATHLPNLREGRQPAAPDELPRQRKGITPQMHGRYPDFDVMEEADNWDETTRQLVFERLDSVPPIRFFTRQEAITLGCFVDLVMAQDRDPKIPVLAMVDAKLYAGELDGFRHHDLPDDRETWRLVARGLDAAARQHGDRDFATATSDCQQAVIQAFADGRLHGEVWDQLPPSKAWSVVMRAVLNAFYSHPWAWNEIGFGGPAYPRGYARFGVGQRESWEGLEAFELDPVEDTHERGVEGV